MSHEIESYNPATGALVAWVKIPSLLSAVNTQIYMYYGDPSSPNQEDVPGVWASNFTGVWHLDETAGTHHDAAAGLDNAFIQGSVTQNATGKMDGADGFNGPAVSWIDVSPSPALGANAPFTIEAWFYIDVLQSQWIGITQRGRETNNDWLELMLNNSNRLTFGWDWQGGKGGNVTGSVLSAGQWYHGVASYDGTNRRLYLNGGLDAGPSAGTYAGNAANWSMGTDFNGNYFDGTIDEVRISSVARSASWIQTEYNNQSSPSTFYVLGAPEAKANFCPTASATSTGVTTSSSATISHTTSGVNRLMLVGVSIAHPSAAPPVSSITYNGTNLSLVGARATSDGFARVEIWRLLSPDTGTHDVVVTLSGLPSSATVGVMTFTGVNQTSPLGSFSSAIGDSSSGSTTVASAAGELVFGAIVIESSSNFNLIPGASQTEYWDLFQAPKANGGGSTAPGAASVPMSWSWSSADKWAIGGVSIKP